MASVNCFHDVRGKYLRENNYGNKKSGRKIVREKDRKHTHTLTHTYTHSLQVVSMSVGFGPRAEQFNVWFGHVCTGGHASVYMHLSVCAYSRACAHFMRYGTYHSHVKWCSCLRTPSQSSTATRSPSALGESALVRSAMARPEDPPRMHRPG